MVSWPGIWHLAGSFTVPIVVGPRQSGYFIPAGSIVEEALDLLPAADRLVKAVFPECRAFELVLVGQSADGLCADPQLLAQLSGTPELAGYPRGFDRQIEVSQDTADLGELGRSGKGGGAYGADQVVEQLAVLVDGQLKLLHGVALLSSRMGRQSG